MIMSTIIDNIAETFWKIIIGLVGGIFKLVNSAYRIFLALAEADIFKNAEFDIITKTQYILFYAMPRKRPNELKRVRMERSTY